jgi:hypothetical protein
LIWSNGSTWTSSPRPEAGHSLRKAYFVESVRPCFSGQQGVVEMPAEPPRGRKIKSGPAGAGEVSRGEADDPAGPLAMANLHTFAVTGPIWRASQGSLSSRVRG